MLNSAGQELKSEFRKNEAVCQQVIGFFQLIANKTRFRIVCVLARGEFCVKDIAEIVGECTLSNISQQLRMLKLAGLVDSRRQERRIMYRLTDEKVRHMIGYFRQKFL